MESVFVKEVEREREREGGRRAVEGAVVDEGRSM